jgi:hypothetical protein
MSAATLDRQETVAALRASLDFLAAVALPEIYRFGFPAIFQAVWQLITDAAQQDEGEEYIAIGIPRGFAKTVFLKIFTLFLILFSTRRFILINCNTMPLAENFIADIADLLDNPNIVAVFGNWRSALEIDRQELKKFSFLGRDITLMGVGTEGSVRGANIKYVRPDVMIMDDMQSREDAESPATAKAQLLWMLGTLMLAKAPERCLFIFVGNMYPVEGSILRKLKHMPEWKTFITPAILEDGNSIWPELKSVDRLLADLAMLQSAGEEHIFYSEIQNDEEAGTRSGVDTTKIVAAPQEWIEEHALRGCVIIDPSLGKKKSDDVAIGVILWFEETPVLWELAVGKFNPRVVIETALKLAFKYRLRAIGVESVAYQQTLVFWFNDVMQQLGIEGPEPCELYPGGAPKTSRIITMFKDLVTGMTRLSQAVRNRVVNQITMFNPAKTTNKDDILDVLTYVRKMENEYGDLLIRDQLLSDADTRDLEGEEPELLDTPF